MNLVPERKPAALLFNPFVYAAGGRALGLGLAVILLTGLLAAFGRIHFDGVLDTHVGAVLPFGFVLTEGLVDWLCLSSVLLVFGKMVSRTSFRVIDLLGTEALARWPTLIMALILLVPGLNRHLTAIQAQGENAGLQPSDAVVLLTLVVTAIPLSCWTIWLMYRAYAVSCNLRGGRAVGSFIAGLVLAEILSKVVFIVLLRRA
jgi:hypothetical protein